MAYLLIIIVIYNFFLMSRLFNVFVQLFRVLDPPSIGYKSQASCPINPKEPGVWRPRNLEYRDGRNLKNWVFMDFKKITEKQFNDILISFKRMGNEVILF